jgi:hypothetical protein
MVEHYRDHWARQMFAHHSHFKCGQTMITNLNEPQGVQYLVYGLSKSIQSRKDFYNKSLGLPRLVTSL